MDEAGEYTIVVQASGKDADGGDLKEEARARFIVYEEDVELADWAADDKFLEKLAHEGGGQFRRGAKLAEFLEQPPEAPAPRTREKRSSLPDWGARPGPGDAPPPWSPFLPVFFLLFTGVLAAEWFLRRRWGMV
jgi:hypothetical protein